MISSVWYIPLLRVPKVAIFIVTFNNESDLPRLLSSLNNLNYKDCEVLFCDNASTDKSVSIIESFGYKVIKNRENLWFAEANNQLQKNNPGYDYIFLLNPDTEIDRDCIDNIIELMESDTEIGISQPLILRLSDKNKINTKGNKLHFGGFGYVSGDGSSEIPSSITEIGYASGAALCLRASAMNSEIFRGHFKAYHEDLDLSWRVKLAGYKVVLCPSAKVFHKYNFTKGSYKWFLMELNRYKVLLTNYSVCSLFLLSPYLVFVELVVILQSLKEGWIIQKLKTYFKLLCELPNLWVERTKIQSDRVVGDHAIVLSMTDRIIFPGEEPSAPLKLFNLISKAYYCLFVRALSFLSPKFELQKISKEMEASDKV